MYLFEINIQLLVVSHFCIRGTLDHQIQKYNEKRIAHASF
jgi:hypothetical protein